MRSTGVNAYNRPYQRASLLLSGLFFLCLQFAVGVDMHFDRGAFVEAGDPICTIANPFKTDRTVVEAPFTGLLVGVLENPLVYPGNPLCHLVKLDDRTQRALERNGGIDDPV